MVGWNTLGGHRLWLRDDQGNEYYYAHLSAYSPLAVDGARVNAGDVIAFVGQPATRSAALPPPLRDPPAALLGLGYDGVINPYPYLSPGTHGRTRIRVCITRRRRRGGSRLEPARWSSERQDISTASGLDPKALERVSGPALLGAAAASSRS